MGESKPDIYEGPSVEKWVGNRKWTIYDCIFPCECICLTTYNTEVVPSTATISYKEAVQFILELSRILASDPKLKNIVKTIREDGDKEIVAHIKGIARQGEKGTE